MIDSVQEFMWYYDEPGDYEIYFITKRMFLCGDTVSHSVTVNAPVVEFMVDNVLLPVTLLMLILQI